ncbi:heat shock factor 2-binding protein-like isoform X2 [Mizuhopecten yessoensis]|uniref:heat shock factor 2-binding protein-like isoform X2 n=1 Tax=Mizuhopecten yessoensis TaxID=6573 RepID=UPI000B45BBA9|nr:heat shock factor 2-binding protein-like isoform X2 [Mizuhopecten yessoensis]
MSKAEDRVIVQRDDLARLATEITQLRQNFPKVVNKRVTNAISKIDNLEMEIVWLKQKYEEAEAETQHWKSRCEVAIADCQKEKQDNMQLRCEVRDLGQQLSQQSDYCSSLGSACCTLLWRVSRCEESIQSILVGTKVDEFLCLVTSTLQSYVSAYKSDWPKDDQEETQFILALCGIITNIAASAYGRDFLITNQNGRHVIDTYLNVLSEAPNGKSARLKNLILMALYNISINQKGIKYINSKGGMLGSLSWILQDEKESENKTNTLRLIQSILCDGSRVGAILELNEVLPMSALQQLTKHKSPEVRQLAQEIISDIQLQSDMEQ